LNWEHVELHEVCEVIGGATPKTGEPEFWGGDIPWVTPADLANLKGAYISGTPRMLTVKGLRSCAAKMLPADSVLLSSRAPIGYVAINAVPMATNQGFKSLIPDRSRLDERYLYWWLVSNKATLQRLGVGATFKEISKAIVSRVVIPLPPLPEQRRIASILDDAARILELDAGAARARNGVVSAALASVLLKEAPKYVELASLCTRITDGTHQSPSFTASGVPFFFISNIIGGSVNYDTAKFVSQETFEDLTRFVRAEPGDILYSAVGSYGVPARVESDRPVVFQRHISHIKPDPRKVNSFYLREVMASPVVKQQADRVARGGAQKTVTLGDLAKFRIPLVSESAQAAIERFAHASVEANSLVKKRRALLTELQAAISGGLFMPITTRAEGQL
jgi:type I restriction enzyme, S subunit